MRPKNVINRNGQKWYRIVPLAEATGFSEWQIREYVTSRKNNGLGGAVSFSHNKCYINKLCFDIWAEETNRIPSQQTRIRKFNKEVNKDVSAVRSIQWETKRRGLFKRIFSKLLSI